MSSKKWLLFLTIGICLAVFIMQDGAVNPFEWSGLVDKRQDEVRVPVLLYHSIARGDNSFLSPETFESHLKALQSAGYHTISLRELKDWVEKGAGLPAKPIVISFDDGYLNNYELAYPLLKQYQMKVTIFIIGSSVGKNTYKNTGYPIMPHFNYHQAQEMMDSGLVEIQSHSYDMHQWQPYESGPARETACILPGEAREDYIRALRNDCANFHREFKFNTNNTVFAFSYPRGVFDNTSEMLLQEEGFTVTLTTEPGTNTVVKGQPQSLLRLHRYTVEGNLPAAQLLDMIK